MQSGRGVHAHNGLRRDDRAPAGPLCGTAVGAPSATAGQHIFPQFRLRSRRGGSQTGQTIYGPHAAHIVPPSLSRLHARAAQHHGRTRRRIIQKRFPAAGPRCGLARIRRLFATRTHNGAHGCRHRRTRTGRGGRKNTACGIPRSSQTALHPNRHAAHIRRDSNRIRPHRENSSPFRNTAWCRTSCAWPKHWEAACLWVDSSPRKR